MKPLFIAEIKTQSPFGYKSDLPFAKLMELAIEYGDVISVHTNALWGGDFNAIAFVRRNTNKPILAKGFHTDDDVTKALEHGASYATVIDRFAYTAPCYGVFTELSYKKAAASIGGVARDPSGYSDKEKDTIKNARFICNARNLKTGEMQEDPYKYTLELNRFIKRKLWVCQASGIKTPEDVKPGVNAFIVGTHLVDYCKALKEKPELVGAKLKLV